MQQRGPISLLLIDPQPSTRRGIERLIGDGSLCCELHVASRQDAVARLGGMPDAVAIVDATSADAARPVVEEFDDRPVLCLVSDAWLAEGLHARVYEEGKCWHVLEIRDADDWAKVPGAVAHIAYCSRRLAEVRESEARFRHMADHAPVMLWITDPDGRCTFLSKPCLDFRGRLVEEELGRGWIDGLHPDDREAALRTFEAALASRYEFRLECRLLRFDGQYRWILSHGTPRFLPDGTFLGYIGSATDITDFKRAEEAARRSHDELEARVAQRTEELEATNRRLAEEVARRAAAQAAFQEERERYQALVETNPHGIQEIDVEGVITFANAACHRMFGYPPGSMAGVSVLDLLADPEDAESLAARFRTILAEQPHPSPEMLQNRTLDGRVIDVRIDWDYLRDEHGEVRGFVSVVTDLTEIRRAEDRLQRHFAELAHMARLSTMGETVSGLAHELNQPLSAIVNFARAAGHRLASGTGAPGEIAECLQQIAEQGERAAEIVRRLRHFFRRGEAERRPVDVNRLVRDLAILLEVDARLHGARLELELEPSLPPVSADRLQIEQVVANLVRNGLEAMQHAPAEERTVTIHTGRRADGSIEVAVEDQGVGLDPDAGPRMFEPFFTTKPAGMGMGLSISRTIVETHGGHLDAVPSPKRGAVFRFALPAGGQGDPS